MADPNTYTVGWICALGTELVAAASFLDKKHDRPDNLPVHDNNSYILGQIDKHNIVIAALPNGQYGLVSAATVARDMVRSFPNVRIGLMVGIGGGAPSSKHDIRLGDVVVSSPSSGSDSGGVFQYDFGKAIQDSSFVVTGHLNQPPTFMLTAVNTLAARYTLDGHDIEKSIEDKLASNNRLRAGFRKPDATTDMLYNSAYKHAGLKDEECKLLCDASQLARSSEQSESRDSPTIHYGIIASANQLMKDANLRDKLSAENDILCFEMEAAGLMNQFPCIVIRGICDYSDTHKNKVWQGYAAMAAAAYAKDLIREIAPNKVEAKRKLGEFLSDVNDKLDTISTAVEDNKSDLQDDKERKRRLKITKWLAAPDVTSNLNRATEARHPGSGQRLINDEAYQEWRRRSNSFLWLHGIPGCGKTVLTSTIINDLRASPNCIHALYYFYFDFTDTRKQTFESCVRSLLSQMYHTSERGREEVDALYEFCNVGKDQPSNRSLQTSFANVIRSSETWIVLDALDECKVRVDLLRWLRDLRNEEAKIHVIATSRPEQDIEVTMKQLSCSQREKIAIDSDILEADIKSYVHEVIEKDVDFDTWKSMPKVREEIETSLVGKAHGMFRWVWCQLSALKKCKDRISLQKTLASLPNDLDETYSRILANIPPEYSDHTFRILQFLTYSERPLRIEEAVDAIAVKLEPGVAKGYRFDVQDRMPNPTDIVGYCCGLAVVVERKNYHSTDQELQLAHFSVKDYLTSDRLKNNNSPCFRETSAQSVIAEVCLKYLLEIHEWTQRFRSQQWSTPQHGRARAFLTKFHFEDYSARYWASHAAIIEYHSQTTFDLAKELFLDQSQMQHWLSLCRGWPDDNDGWNIRKPLYYASLLGLTRCCEMLVDEGADVNARGGSYGSALYAAFHKGHQKIVDMLLRKGADPNGRSKYCHHSILWYAVKEGHQDRVRLLLDSGAQVDEVGDRGYTPLAKAAEQGYISIMADLLNHQANANGCSDKSKLPLLLACRSGHTQAAELLIKHNAVLRGVLRSVGMFEPANQSYWKISQLLLASKGGHRLKDPLGRSWLMLATIHNKSKIVDVLLTSPDLDVNAGDHWGATAISFAARYGYSEIFRKIAALSNVDFAAGDQWGRTSLSWAQKQRHNDIASYIVRRLQRQNNDKSIQSQMLVDASPWLGPRTFETAFRVHDDFCAVCLATLQICGPRYECAGCDKDGGLAVCEVCYELGARCPVGSHLLCLINPTSFDESSSLDELTD
ncbi:hypothetical protein E8E14_010117 [Neopestalotiopsis sp. 37M]|nr:hypothetical protein E8E14_010117 [Neopestalotiopsis sp. 37M]